MIVCIVGGLVLSMNTATMDGSRALYGISKDGMTISELGVLNRFHVPGRAMTLDALLNIFLITYFTGVLPILAVSNIGYVFATCCALSGFLLLRRDRPNWPRPIRLSNVWVPICAVLLRSTPFLLVAAASSTRAASSGSRAMATAGTRPAPACSSCSRRSCSTSTATWCRTRSP